MKNPRQSVVSRTALALSICVCLTFGGWANAATYLVNPTHAAADDAGPGSDAKPFKSVEHALTKVQPGDTVVLAPGSYGRVTLRQRGTKDKPIVIKAAAAPSQDHLDRKKTLDPLEPVFTPGNPKLNAVTKGFALNGARFVRVENFEIADIGDGVGGISLKDTDGVAIVRNFLHDLNPRKGNHGGIRADSHDNKNVLVQDNTLFRCAGTSINMMGENWIVEGNEVARGTNISTATGENVGGEDAIRPFGKGHIIRRNYIHDFLDEEQFPKSNPHLDAFQVFSVYPQAQFAHDILIENNYCANIGQMFMGSDTGAEKSGTNPIHHITLRGNVFRGAHAYSLIIGRGCDSFTVENNTVTESVYGAVIVSGKSDHVVVRNNIFYNNSQGSAARGGGRNAPSSIDESSREGSTMDYNLCNHTSTYPPKAAAFDNNSKIGVDPRFVDAAAGDYRLQKDSPAIGAGDPALRSPDAKRLDLGAFQFGKPENDWFLPFLKK